MEVTGSVIAVDQTARDSKLYGAGHVPDVGTFVITPGFLRWLPSKTCCPYCHEPMARLDGVRAGRIKRRQSAGAVLVDIFPETHDMLGCFACHQAFTQLTEGAPGQ